MDAVHESDQPIDIGICSQHNRVFECYCSQCYCMICPSCLMFGEHRGHDVCKIQEGAKELRGKINGAAKDGLLKFDKTENVLLDVRHAKLSLDQNAEEMIKKSEKYFDDLIIIIKSRKATFLGELGKHFQEQSDLIDKMEQKWLYNQQVSQKILKLQSSKDDIKVMEQAKGIVEGIQSLSQTLDYKEINLIETIESDIIVGKHTYQNKELADSLKSYLKKGRSITKRIKC